MLGTYVPVSGMCAEYVNAPSVLQVTARSVPVALPILVVSGAMAVLAACGGSGDGASEAPTPTASIVPTTIVERSADDLGDVEQVCAELEIVHDLSDKIADGSDEILIAVGSGEGGTEEEIVASFGALASQIEADLPELLAAYDRAAAAAPSDVADEIRAVADGTAVLTPPLAEAFRAADSVEDLAELEGIFAAPELQVAATKAGISSLRLDNFTNVNCGFQFSNT